MSHHGGADQAVYLYSAVDYAWWSEQLGRPIPIGTFGENLTLSSLGNSKLRIGDRYHIGDVVLEVTFGRVPCAKLSARMGDPAFLKRFVAASRPGIYTRVLQTGTVQQGTSVRFVPSAENHPTVAELFDLFHAKQKSPDLIHRGLAAPIAERARDAFNYWLQFT